MRPDFTTQEELYIASIKNGLTWKRVNGKDVNALIIGIALFAFGMLSDSPLIATLGASIPTIRLTNKVLTRFKGVQIISSIILKFDSAARRTSTEAEQAGASDGDKPPC